MAQQAQAQNQAQAAQAAHAQARNLAMMKQNQAQSGGQQSGGQGTLKLMNFVDQLGKFTVSVRMNFSRLQLIASVSGGAKPGFVVAEFRRQVLQRERLFHSRALFDVQGADEAIRNCLRCVTAVLLHGVHHGYSEHPDHTRRIQGERWACRN